VLYKDHEFAGFGVEGGITGNLIELVLLLTAERLDVVETKTLNERRANGIR